jgi:phosphoglycerate dehydrogenase-like enzyme
MTAQAFDAVEIFATPGTPEPTPIPTVAGPDSTLFVYYDAAAGQYNLGRREAAQGDNQYGSVLAKDINLARPAVTGDGSIALFVSPDSDLCAVNTADFNSRKCSGLPGLVHSVAISPDGKRAAFVLRDKQSGEPEGKITVLDLAANKPSIYNLVAPIADGVDVDTVIYADSMTFSTDGTALIYDALSQLKFNNGPTVQRWSIYSLHLDSGQTSILVAPRDGVDSGNPAVGRAGSRYVVYDALQAATEASSIMVLDLFTGQAAEVATAPGGFANPAFLGDESGVSYSAADSNAFATGRSLFKQDLTEDRLHGQGNPTLWYQDANLGIIYRRGDFQASNALPTVSLTISADQIGDANGVIVLTPKVAAESVSRAENLLAVGRFGVGYDSVDVPACTAADVLVFITAGAVDRSVAEATVGWMLAIAHHVRVKDRLVRTGQWDERSKYMGSELRDRTFGSVGLGGIARATIELLRGFGLKEFLAYDPLVEKEAAAKIGVRLVGLDELLKESDFVSLHCPLNESTRGLLGVKEIALMKPSAFLINTARGGIVEENALFDALQAGRIAGAALDCFAEEPVTKPHRFGERENVLLAPHSIAWTNELFRDIGRMVCQGMVDLSLGKRPRGVVNPQVFERPDFQAKWSRICGNC